MATDSPKGDLKMNPIRVEPDTSYKAFNEYLNDYYGIVKVCDLYYDTSEILQVVEKKQYEELYDKWKEVEIEDYSKWECDVCGSEFDEQEDAEECCQDEVFQNDENSN